MDLQIGIGRKLEATREDLALLEEEGKAKGFFNNVENADRLTGLVEDVRDAIMDYQVRVSNTLPFLYLRFLQTSLQQDTYNKNCLLIVSPILLLPCFVADEQIGISGPDPSGQDVSHLRCRVFVWEQAGVSEGNPEGCPVGNRTLVKWRAGAARLLAEWARWNGEIDHCSNHGRGGLRGRKTGSELLLLTRLR